MVENLYLYLNEWSTCEALLLVPLFIDTKGPNE